MAQVKLSVIKMSKVKNMGNYNVSCKEMSEVKKVRSEISEVNKSEVIV